MFRRRLPRNLGAAAVVVAAVVLAPLGSGAAARPSLTAGAARSTVSRALIGAFSGTIRTGPLADLSLTGTLAVRVTPTTGAIAGVLLSATVRGRAEVLAHVTGHDGAHSATLVFRTPHGRTITGTAASTLAPGKLLRGSLHTAGGSGDWIVLPPGAVHHPVPIVCLVGAPCRVIGNPPLVIPGIGNGTGSGGPPNGSGEPDDDTFCGELEAGLDLSDPVVQAVVESFGCSV